MDWQVRMKICTSLRRFSRLDDGNLLYDFTVNDPTVWEAEWSGKYEWQSKPHSKVYEYACHEGNYAMGNILRRARLLESGGRLTRTLRCEQRRRRLGPGLSNNAAPVLIGVSSSKRARRTRVLLWVPVPASRVQ